MKYIVRVRIPVVFRATVEVEAENRKDAAVAAVCQYECDWDDATFGKGTGVVLWKESDDEE